MSRKYYALWITLLALLLAGGISFLVTGIQIAKERPRLDRYRWRVEQAVQMEVLVHAAS